MIHNYLWFLKICHCVHNSLLILLHHHFLDRSWDLFSSSWPPHIFLFTCHSPLLFLCLSFPLPVSLLFIFKFSFIYWKGFLHKELFNQDYQFWHLIILYCCLNSPLLIVSPHSLKYTDVTYLGRQILYYTTLKDGGNCSMKRHRELGEVQCIFLWKLLNSKCCRLWFLLCDILGTETL